MKFTPNSSVSSSTTTTTTTTTSFSDNFYRSKGNALGCLSGFLSRILCSRTHNSDPIQIDKQQQHLLRIDSIVDGSATPNVVARLMGLDSMPGIDFKTTRNGFDSIARSKSENSGDFRGETEDQYLRKKTAFSFRETPNYFELEDDDFFVLSFEDKGEKKKKKGHKQRGKRDKCGRKQRKNRDEQSKDRVVFSYEDRLSLKISAQNSDKFDNKFDVQNQSYHLPPLKGDPSCRKDEMEVIKERKKKKKDSCLSEVKEAGTGGCDSENSSPVSVLDHSEFSSDPEFTTSEEYATNLRSDFVARDFPNEQSNGSTKGHNERGTDGIEERNVGLIKRRDCYYRKRDKKEMLRRASRLAETEINNSKWKYRGILTSEELEDATGTEFGQQIFDQLVSELLDQLVVGL